MRSTASRLALAIGVAVLSACSSEKTAGPSGSIEGTYSLQTVNNSTLPYIVDQGTSGGVSFKREIISGAATINANRTYNLTFEVRETTGSTPIMTNFSDVGGWTQTGSQLSLSSGTGLTLVATISGKSITASVPLSLVTTLTVVFTKN